MKRVLFMRCNNCGKDNSEGKFCAYCGCELKDNKNKTKNKKKIIIIISIITAVCAVIAGIVLFNILKNPKNEQLEKNEQLLKEGLADYYTINTQILDIAKEYEDEEGFIPFEKKNDAIKKVGDYADKLLNEGKIKEYDITEGVSVWIKFSSGIEYVYTPPEKDTDSSIISTYQPCLLTYNTSLQNFGKTAVDGSAIKIENQIRDYSFRNNYDNDAVTLDAVCNIQENKLVIWHGHGGYNEKTHSFICTGVKLNKSGFYNDPINQVRELEYTDEFLEGNLIITESGYVAVGSRFIEKKLGRIDGSIIYIGTCHSGEDDVLANAFINKGASAVIGNKGTICTTYNLKSIQTVFSQMIANTQDSKYYDTLEYAVNYSLDKNGGGCCSKHQSHPVIFGNSEYRLSQEEFKKIAQDQTEAPKHTYTAMQLINKSLDEIKEIMGGDYDSEHIQLSNAFSSNGAPYIYNYTALPGFAFATNDNDYYGISIMDGAKLNDEISSDMTYNQIADIIGDHDAFRVGRGLDINFNFKIDGYDVVFCFVENDYIRNNNPELTVPISIMRASNPSLQSIGLRRKQTITPTEKPTEKQTEKVTEKPKEKANLEFTYEKQELDLGTYCEVICNSDIDLNNCDISREGDKCFKIYITKDRYQMIAFGEGEETFNITAPDGRTGTFTLSSIVNKQILDDPSWYCNTMVPFQSVDGKTRNQLMISKFENGHVVFNIQQGSQNRPYMPHVEGDIYDENKVSFNATDSYGNKYKGFMEFDTYSIYLRMELVEESIYSEGTMECDCRLLAVS